MNHHLQALADQATDDILGVPILNKQRFAELILRECVAIAEQGLSPAVAQAIQHRFGVDHAENH